MIETPDFQAQIGKALERSREALAEDPVDPALIALADLFQFCSGPENDLVPAEMAGIIGRLADAFVEIFETEEEIMAKVAHEAQEREAEDRRRQELNSASQFSVRITRTDQATVYVGPYTFRFQSEAASSYFRGCAHNTAGAQKATVEVLPFDANVPHRAGMLPRDPAQICTLMSTDDQEPGDFPDLYARLAAFHGEAASPIWSEACRILDGDAGAVGCP